MLQNHVHFEKNTKRNSTFLYHIEVGNSDEIQYVEMRHHKFNSKAIYLMWTSIKCLTKSTLNVKRDISIIKCESWNQ